MLDITWTIRVDIPQLEKWGPLLMAELTGIQDAINSLVTNQADGQEALAAHLTAIEEEIRQLGESPSQVQLDALADQVNAAAATSAKGAADLRAMTQQIQGMVPDTPA